VKVESIWGSTIYNIDDLPFKAATELPHIYGRFREKSEGTRVRALLPTPKKGELPFVKNSTKDIDGAAKFIPDLVKDFGFTKEEVDAPKDKRECYNFVGGEDAGLKRVKEYVWDT
jgi:deoxyribodipyrimidine photo-lyase